MTCRCSVPPASGGDPRPSEPQRRSDPTNGSGGPEGGRHSGHDGRHRAKEIGPKKISGMDRVGHTIWKPRGATLLEAFSMGSRMGDHP